MTKHQFSILSKSRLDLYEQIGELSFPCGTNFAGEWQLVLTRIGNVPEDSNTLGQNDDIVEHAQA